jgi:small subunit ribosomal protein S16
LIEVESERAQYWLGVGAQPSEAVAAILKVTGDWQKSKGEPGAEGTLRTAEPKRDKAEIFNEALKEAASEPKAEAVTKKSKKAEAKKDEAPAPAETPGAETPEGATEQAETEETKAVDAEAQEKSEATEDKA